MKLRRNGAIPPLSQYVLMACIGRTYFTYTFSSFSVNRRQSLYSHVNLFGQTYTTSQIYIHLHTAATHKYVKGQPRCRSEVGTWIRHDLNLKTTNKP